MGKNTFLESGALLTMADQRTYFMKDLSLLPSQENEFLMAPQFSLKHLDENWIFKSKTENLNDFLPLTLNSSEYHLSWVSDLQEYLDTYSKIQILIEQKELQKVVPYLTYKAPKPLDFKINLLPSILNHLNENKIKDEYLFGFWSEDQGFIGSTPEVLIQKKINSEYVTVMALAGTLPKDDMRKMHEDPKLSNEHQIVRDDISKKLSKYRLNWNQPVEKKYGILKHLYSTVDFLSNENVKDLISTLSPTSALGIYPFEKLEKYKDLIKVNQRGHYGAPFGLVLEDQFNIVVCLRGLFWDQNYLYIHIGGGVTAQSDLESELSELELKFQSTKKKLGLK